MLINDPSTRASQALPRTGGGSLPPHRTAMLTDLASRDSKSTASREALPRTTACRLRPRRQLACRTAVRHLLRLETPPAAFNLHSPPPPERRFSATGSFGYRPRDGIASLADLGSPRPLSKRLSASCKSMHDGHKRVLVAVGFGRQCINARRSARSIGPRGSAQRSHAAPTGREVMYRLRGDGRRRSVLEPSEVTFRAIEVTWRPGRVADPVPITNLQSGSCRRLTSPGSRT